MGCTLSLYYFIDMLSASEESIQERMEINNAEYSSICRSICHQSRVVTPLLLHNTRDKPTNTFCTDISHFHIPVPLPCRPRNSIFPICHRIVECVAYYINWMGTQYTFTHLQLVVVVLFHGCFDENPFHPPQPHAWYKQYIRPAVLIWIPSWKHHMAYVSASFIHSPVHGVQSEILHKFVHSPVDGHQLAFQPLTPVPFGPSTHPPSTIEERVTICFRWN